MKPDVLEKEINLIRSISRKYVKNHPELNLEFDDLFSEAYLKCMESIKTHDPERGKRTTFLWAVAHNCLNNLVKLEYEKRSKVCLELDLIRKICWSYVKTNPFLEFDDLFSEACIVVLESLPEYHDNKKGRKTTSTWYIVHSHINNLLINERKRATHEQTVDSEILEGLLQNQCFPNPEQALIAKESWEEMATGFSPEAMTICDMLLNDTELYLPLGKPKLCRGIIFKKLRTSGWKWNSIWDAFREIKNAVNQSA